MIMYVDTSVLLRLVLGEPEALTTWTTAVRAISSDLARVEALKMIDRDLVFATHDRALASGALAVGFRLFGAPA
jgi:hypothetical protein